MNERLWVSSSPHIQANVTTRQIMSKVLLALLPAMVASGIIFGYGAVVLICVTVSACIIFEVLWALLFRQKQTVGDLSAVVTGVLLAFNFPSTLPIWMAVLGAFVAIIIVKMLFGGIGNNFANPAIVARMVLALSFPSAMTNYPHIASVTSVEAFHGHRLYNLPLHLKRKNNLRTGTRNNHSAYKILWKHDRGRFLCDTYHEHTCSLYKQVDATESFGR